MNTLLFIDDDTDLLLSNQKYFSRSGYEVQTADSAAAALALLRRFRPDCIILDVMLPGISGFDLLKKIRTLTDAPVIFLSGRTEESSKVAGLLLGGNDYIGKPYSLKELSARVQVQIRSAESRKAPARISIPPLSLDIAGHKAYYRESEEIILSNKEYDFLHVLMTRPGRTVPFHEIGQALWGEYSDYTHKSLLVVASRLRKKLESYDGLQSSVQTVREQGYKFIGGRGAAP